MIYNNQSDARIDAKGNPHKMIFHANCLKVEIIAKEILYDRSCEIFPTNPAPIWLSKHQWTEQTAYCYGTLNLILSRCLRLIIAPHLWQIFCSSKPSLKWIPWQENKQLSINLLWGTSYNTSYHQSQLRKVDLSAGWNSGSILGLCCSKCQRNDN